MRVIETSESIEQIIFIFGQRSNLGIATRLVRTDERNDAYQLCQCDIRVSSLYGIDVAIVQNIKELLVYWINALCGYHSIKALSTRFEGHDGNGMEVGWRLGGKWNGSWVEVVWKMEWKLGGNGDSLNSQFIKNSDSHFFESHVGLKNSDFHFFESHVGLKNSDFHF